MSLTVLIFLSFVLGTIIGSFLNVVILRWNSGASIAADRSRCFSCGKTLAWYELIPLVSFLIQGGRCRACGSKISWQYPLIEALTGLLFALVVWVYPPILATGGVSVIAVANDIFYFAIWSVLVVITVYDLRHKIIPDTFSYLFALLSLLLLVIHIAETGLVNWTSILAGPALALPLFLLWLGSRGRWMGLGDAKFVLGMGWLLGLDGGGAALVLAFWIGALVGLALMAFRRVGMNSEIPFAPFLIAGTLIVFATGITFTGIATFL